MTYQNLKTELQKRHTDAIKNCRLFFGFSNEQFNENKTQLTENDTYLSIGGGGYLPKSMYKAFQDSFKESEEWFQNSLKTHKLRIKHIDYELANHEAYYTGCIDSTLEALGETYTYKEVMKVYKFNLENYDLY